MWSNRNSACREKKGSPPSSSDNRLRSALCVWRSSSLTDCEAAVSKFSHSLAKPSLWRTPTSNCPKLNNCSKVQIIVFLGRPTTEHPQSCIKEGWQQSTHWNKDTEHSGSDEQAIVGSQGADRLREKLSKTALTALRTNAEKVVSKSARSASAPGSLGIKIKGK